MGVSILSPYLDVYHWYTSFDFTKRHYLLPVGGEDGTREADHSQDPLPSGRLAGAALQFDKQETVVVRPYPQVQTLGQTPTLAQHMSIQPSSTVTVAAPPAHLAAGQQPAFTDGSIKVPIA